MTRRFGELQVVSTILFKELRIEAKSRVVTNQVVPFAALVMVMFAIALDDDDVLPRIAGGLIWMATVFSLLIIVHRSYAIDTADGSLDAIRLSGVRLSHVFLGKALAITVQLMMLNIVLIFCAVLFYRVKLDSSTVGVVGICVVVATIGLGFVGALFGAVSANSRSSISMLPLLLMPMVTPVLVGATKSFDYAFGSSPNSQGWVWIGSLVVFAAVFGVGGSLSFVALIEE